MAAERASAESLRMRSVTRHIRIDVEAATLTVTSASGPGMGARTLDLSAFLAIEVDHGHRSIVRSRSI